MRQGKTVFLSSTRLDLQPERETVLEQIQKSGFVARTIDDLSAEEVNAPNSVELELQGCDAMVMILAGRYGTVDWSGVGYLEREYQAALEQGIPVCCLLIEDISKLPANRIQKDGDRLLKLLNFRERIIQNKDAAIFYYTETDILKNKVEEFLHGLEAIESKKGTEEKPDKASCVREAAARYELDNQKPDRLAEIEYETEKRDILRDVKASDADYSIGNILCETQTQQYSFETLMLQVLRGNYFVPKYQRKFRWNSDQVQNLVNSLIRGLPIPPIYVCRREDGRFEILDGQQRIYSLLFYYLSVFPKARDGKETSVDLKEISEQVLVFAETEEDCFRDFRVKNTPFYKAAKLNDERTNRTVTILSPHTYKMKWIQEENGTFSFREMEITFDKLTEKYKRRIANSFLSVTTIYPPSHMRTRTVYQIFKNLNSGGVQLSRQELRNGVYDSRMYSMLFLLNNDITWQRFQGSNPDPEYADMEFLLRLCALRFALRHDPSEGYQCIDNEGKKLYSDNYAKLIDSFSEIVMNWHEQEILPYKLALERFFDRFHLRHSREHYGGYQKILEALFLIQEKEAVAPPITDDLVLQIREDEQYRNCVWDEDNMAEFGKMKKRLERVSEIVRAFQEQQKEGNHGWNTEL